MFLATRTFNMLMGRKTPAMPPMPQTISPTLNSFFRQPRVTCSGLAPTTVKSERKCKSSYNPERNAISPAETFTVVDAIERAWTSPEYYVKYMGKRIYLMELTQNEYNKIISVFTVLNINDNI